MRSLVAPLLAFGSIAFASVSSVVPVAGQLDRCSGTFVHQGAAHDVMVLPASCLENLDTGGIRVANSNGETVRSLVAVIHPYLLKKKIYDLTKVPSTFDFAVALFPRGTAAAISPIARDFAPSVTGTYSETANGTAKVTVNFDEEADLSATDLTPDTSVEPGAPVYDGETGGIVAFGLGCRKNSGGQESCIAVSLHDALSRDVLAAAKNRFPQSLANLELPTKTHRLGHLGLFGCRRRVICQPRCVAPAPTYCRPTYTYAPSSNSTRQTQIYARGPGASAGNVDSPVSNATARVDSRNSNRNNNHLSHSDSHTQTHADNHAQTFRSGNNSNNTNTFNPVFSPNFNPTITVNPNIVVTPQTSSGQSSNSANVGSNGSSASTIPAGRYTSTSYTPDSEVEARIRYEAELAASRAADETRRADELRKSLAQSKADLDRQYQDYQAARSQIAQESSALAEARIAVTSQQEENARLRSTLQQSQAEVARDRESLQNAQREFSETQRKHALEIAALRTDMTNQINALKAERDQLAEQRKQMEIDRRVDRAGQLRQELDPKELEGVTGEEGGPEAAPAPSPDLQSRYEHRLPTDAQLPGDFGVKSLIAKNSAEMGTDVALHRQLDNRSVIAAASPFRTHSEIGQSGGITLLAFNELKQNGEIRSSSPRNVQLVVRSASPFLGSESIAYTRSTATDGTPLLAMRVTR